ncbi:MAG TPA: pyruvate:ferredoxin (flavodoxin) oxidoreductase [Candidatus Pelethenecus faecipullorum]|uniref:Pyruvate:ferredoxin (Flavodoxin) oxidoreductase n=1 Tax=Candidatus Pelethenecus faecipullorum TaxID=2840900 RepID=A0A9D1KJG4_9MOLU|nr:pyruvate:ferredoxin (flavodoxin) oxidoreductase [Candidatus Pelethenecus faecipullorum]
MSEKTKRMAIDGNYAAAYSSYAFTEVAGIYPITPSSPMAEYTDEWASQGKKNLFGMPVKVIEMQSEGGAAGTVHGSLEAGALTTTYTASQGLLLKIPNMYKIAGECLPGVIHVSARTIAAQSLAIFGDHQDVMACRQTGFAMLCAGSVQETMDLAGVAHLSAIKTSIPFLHFFDGFRTSHEVNTIEPVDYAVFDRLLDRDAVAKFRANALNPLHPKTRGTAQNDDVYFQTRELQAQKYEGVSDVVEYYMDELAKATGRQYKPFSYYGAADAQRVIVAMGSVTECAEEVVDYLTARGEKVGILKVHLYRPFDTKKFLASMPKTVQKIAVLDRTIEQGALYEPLCLDVQSVYYNSKQAPLIVGGRYGLSSKDTTPDLINAVYTNLKQEEPKDHFTLGINDDIKYTSLSVTESIDVADPTTTELLFFGLGSDGTVGACKNISKIVGDYTEFYSQSYAAYDSKKSGGSTRLHLRFSKKPIRSTYLVNQPHFVSCSLDAYLDKFDMISGLRDGGTFLLNTVVDKDHIADRLPNSYKRILAQRHAKFYIIAANAAARECGFRPGLGVNTIMQSAFFKLNEQIMDYEEAKEHMKEFATKTYLRKGQELVDQNHKAIDMGGTKLVEVPVDPAWADLTDEVKTKDLSRPKFVRDIADVINAIQGDSLPLSAFAQFGDDCHMPQGTAAYEKRGVATDVPLWTPENCIQCNQCAFVCPHACIRPFLCTEEEVNNAPEGAKFLDATGFKGYKYTLQVSTLDCTGCGVCLTVCPGKPKKAADGTITKSPALTSHTMAASREANEAEICAYFYDHVTYKGDVAGTANAKNVQFSKPLFEFSGACGGCGETPYVKAVSQLFGDRMMVANATGCTSIYSGSYPSSPYTTNALGHGPAWANSLFEDNAEFGFGMHMAVETLRDRIQNVMALNRDEMPEEVQQLCVQWMENRSSGIMTKELAPKIVKAMEAIDAPYAKEILSLKDYLVKTSQWIIGGDGWAYDIGYGGLDHVIANNEDVNILVVDTEVYSNTGGQASKSSRTGAIAKFAAAGKPTSKKDLASIAMAYGHVYVATVSHGYNQNQVIKALKEAEAYQGPSIVICYSPCIAHNIKKGLFMSQMEAKKATECGYWPTFRYNPDLAKEGKNPFQMDSKEPDWSKYNDFLMNEGRYAQLVKINPERAKELLEHNLKDAQKRYANYVRLASMEYPNQK